MSPCRALVRVRVPDRPGALGLVASRIGAVKGDIVGIEVIDRHDGIALDQLSVILPDPRPRSPRSNARSPRSTAPSRRRSRSSTRSPSPASTRSSTRWRSAGHATPRRSPRSSSTRVVELVRPDWCQARGPGVAVGTDRGPTPDDRDRHRVDRAPGVRDHAVVRPRSRRCAAGERALVAGYCDLVDALWLRLPTEAPPGRRTADPDEPGSGASGLDDRGDEPLELAQVAALEDAVAVHRRTRRRSSRRCPSSRAARGSSQ